MKNKITVRLFVPDGSGYRQFDSLSEADKEAFSQRCAERIGTALEPYFSRNITAYKAVKDFYLTADFHLEEGEAYA